MTGSGTNFKPQIWDIVKARIYFDDMLAYKDRPVLVLDEVYNLYCSLKITSNIERKGLGEYNIKLWKAAGLNKPSNIRLSKFLVLEQKSIIEKYGVLYPLDRKELIDQINKFIIVNEANYTKNFIKKVEKRIDENLPPPLIL